MGAFDLKYARKEIVPLIQKVLPENPSFDATIVSFKALQPSTKSSDDRYELQLLSKTIITREQIAEFIRAFGDRSETVYVMRHSNKENDYHVYRMLYKCQHSTYSYKRGESITNSRKHHKKGTNCKSCISVTAKMIDKSIPQTKISIKFDHNHQTVNAKALRYRQPAQSIIEISDSVPANFQKPLPISPEAVQNTAPQRNEIKLPKIDENYEITNNEVELRSDEDNENIDALSKNLSQLVEEMKKNLAYYSDGIKAMNKQISSLIHCSSPAAILNALCSFNKATSSTLRCKIRSTKRIGGERRGSQPGRSDKFQSISKP